MGFLVRCSLEVKAKYNNCCREMLDVLKERFRVSRVVFDSWYWSEKLVTDNVVSRLKSNRVQGRRRGPSRRGTSQWDTPGVYFTSLTLGGRVVMVKLLVREYKRQQLWDFSLGLALKSRRNLITVVV